jgi:hypothetical protein
MTIPGEHTEGPWEAHAWGDDRYEILTAEGDLIADIRGYQGRTTTDADARLMAAAPQLLDALFTALNLGGVARWGAEVVHSESRGNIDVPYHFAVIRAAIAAAVAPGYSGAPTG